MTQYPAPIMSRTYDQDLTETFEWLAALQSVANESGLDRANYLVEILINSLKDMGISQPVGCVTPPVNTKLKDAKSKGYS